MLFEHVDKLSQHTHKFELALKWKRAKNAVNYTLMESLQEKITYFQQKALQFALVSEKLSRAINGNLFYCHRELFFILYGISIPSQGWTSLLYDYWRPYPGEEDTHNSYNTLWFDSLQQALKQRLLSQVLQLNVVTFILW